MTPREKLEALGYELVESVIKSKTAKFRFQHTLLNNEITFYRIEGEPVSMCSSYTDIYVFDDEVPQEEPYCLTLKELDAVREYMKWLEGGIPNVQNSDT